MSLRLAPRNDESQNVARTEWDGEGYPPVGVRCEYFDGGEWMQCEVVAHRKGGWVVLSDDLETDFVTLEALRPMRTPEQIAEEKRHKETHEWLEKISIEYDLKTSSECYKILLAAGLRRQ